MIKTKFFRNFFLAFGLFPITISCMASTTYKLNYNRIKPGEKLEYVAHWGILNIGTGYTFVNTQLYKIGDKSCYRIDVQGQTNGLAKLFYIRDKWSSYVDTSNIYSHKSVRSIREGSYEMDEIVDFDVQNRKATVNQYNKKSKKIEKKRVVDTPENIRDIVGGFMYIRMIDLSNFKVGDVFTINGFYEDEVYRIHNVYLGKETIRWNNQKVVCHKIKPLVPNNKVFDGENSVIAWLSDDNAQNIVRIKAKMFVGNILVNLVQ